MHTGIWTVLGAIGGAIATVGATYFFLPFISQEAADRINSESILRATAQTNFENCTAANDGLNGRLSICERDVLQLRGTNATMREELSTCSADMAAAQRQTAHLENQVQTISADRDDFKERHEDCTSNASLSLNALRQLNANYEALYRCVDEVIGFGTYADAAAEFGRDRVETSLACAKNALRRFAVDYGLIEIIASAFNGSLQDIVERPEISGPNLYVELLSILAEQDAREAIIINAIQQIEDVEQ